MLLPTIQSLENRQLSAEAMFLALRKHGISFFTGVPDSLLKHFCAYVEENTSSDEHIISANEGGAIALAVGHYISSNEIALVYMQNSGLGNAINPLLSLAGFEAYSIPMLLMIGWRGRPGTKDEQQHVHQGRITLPLLDLLHIEYKVLENDLASVLASVEYAIIHIRSHKRPYALVVPANVFVPYEKKENSLEKAFTRERAIRIILDNIDSESLIVATTGKASREVYEYRVNKGQKHSRDFLNVGAMGHTSQIALRVAQQRPDKKVYCFDGDGSVIMHMGGLGLVGTQAPSNFYHIILNNGSHDSVGGQPTVGFDINFAAIAKGCGYKNAFDRVSEKNIREVISTVNNLEGPVLLEVIVDKGSRNDLGRPVQSLNELLNSFMSVRVG
jgi:phosphonopyruvate decarboxylase